jgi:molybdopterin/thiamine biosynthesis adenylyltransferase
MNEDNPLMNGDLVATINEETTNENNNTEITPDDAAYADEVLANSVGISDEHSYETTSRVLAESVVNSFDIDDIIEEVHKELPSNSETILIDDSTVRFSSAEWYTQMQKEVILIAGIGGINSWSSLLISRMKPTSMFLYDSDRVEVVNMAGQLYSNENIGKNKVDALADTISKFSDYRSVFGINELFTVDTSAADIMICGFDNMLARQIFFNSWKTHVACKDENNKKNCLYIDGRLSAEEFQIFCIRGDDEYNMQRYYKDYLFNSSEAEHTLCSYKQTTYCASMIASFITNLLVNFVANKGEGIIPRDLPFFTYYDAKLMFFKTEA